MKLKFILLSFVVTFFVNESVAQISKTTAQMMGIEELEGLLPSEVPNEAILRTMGLSPEEIEMANKYRESGTVPTAFEKEASRSAPKAGEELGDIGLDEIEIGRLTVEPLTADPVFGQEVFRNNRIKFFESAKDVVAPDNYKIGIGDKLAFSVWGFSDYNEQFVVTANGYIVSKLIGRVYLKGLSFEGSRKLLTRKFSQVLDLKRSDMDLTLQYSRDIRVNIVGEVLNPGSYNIAAINTAFNAMVVVGGPKKYGSVRNILVKRKGKTTDTLDIYEYLNQPTDFSPPYLENDDHIVVPVVGPVVSVKGEVRRPQRYELREGESLIDAIGFAGGLTASAYRKNIQIVRYINSQEILIDVDLDSLETTKTDIGLQDGDRVLVRTIPQGYVNTVSAKGAFRINGHFELRPGERISDLLKKTEGVLHDAYLPRAYVLRLNEDLTQTYLSVNISNILKNPSSPDNIELMSFDEVEIFSKHDFEDKYKVWVYGAVRKEGELIYGEGLSLMDAIFLAGGLKPQAANKRVEVSRMVDLSKDGKSIDPIRKVVLTIEIDHDLRVGSKAEKFFLQPYDQVFVRVNPSFEAPRTVALLGEVNYPGTYSLLSKDETVSSLIERAGGLSEYAFADGTNMNRWGVGDIYVNMVKAIKKPNSKYDIVINKGDSIRIPRILDLVLISGAIANYDGHAISAPYFGKRAKYYIQNFAGGFNKRSARGKTYVIHANGIIKKTRNFGLFRIYPKISQGAEVVVTYKPEKPDKSESTPVDWNKTIENVSIKATGVLTLWLLIDRVISATQ